MTSPEASGDFGVTLARLEAKVDVALTQHGAKIEQHGETIQDHETRLRDVERKSTVSPKQLGGVIAAVLGGLGAIYPFLDRFYS